MRIFYTWLTGMGFVLSFLITPLAASDGEVQVEMVVQDIYMVSGTEIGGNAAFLITPDGVAVIDSGISPTAGKRIVEAIREKTDQPIRYLILTHYHWDHTFGTQSFPSGADVIGQETIISNLETFYLADWEKRKLQILPQEIQAIKKEIASLRKREKTKREGLESDLAKKEEELKEMEELRIIKPNLTFFDKMSIRLGNEVIDVLYPEPSHTSCNAVVYFNEHKVLHTGDMLFNGRLPYIDWRAGSDTQNWAEALNHMSEWNIARVIPGHGPIGGRNELIRQMEYLKKLRQRVEEEVKKQKTLEEIQKLTLFPEFTDEKDRKRLSGNIESVFQEITKLSNSQK